MIRLGGMGTILMVVFLIWVLSAATPSQKIERGCRPVLWMGSVVTSVAAFSSDGLGEQAKGWFEQFDYGCQYTVWRFFYESDYKQAVADGLIDPDTGLPALHRRDFR